MGKTHGESGKNRTKEYTIWSSMIARCYRLTYCSYPLYGGRGIKVYEPWHKYENFLKYLLEGDGNNKPIGRRPRGKTLDRINVNGNYEPGNIRWATAKEQANNRRNNTLITIENKTRTVAEWSDIQHIDCETIRQRIDRGWDPIDAVLTSPSRTFAIDNISHTVNEWSQISGIKAFLINQRIRQGWTVRSAVWTPIGGKNEKLV